MIIRDILKSANKILKKSSINNCNLDSELILAHVLQENRSKTIIDDERQIESKKMKIFFNLINQRFKKKPISYITNSKEFWKSKFYVDKNTLIPRPETEHLIEISLKLISKEKNIKILDVGTGSGCILISILKEFKNSSGIGIDISQKALQIARYNAKIHHITNRLSFYHSDIDKFSFGTYDLIVSNPPYITSSMIKNLKDDVKLYEPNIALNGGKMGLDTIIKLIIQTRKLLKINGNLLLEINPIHINKVMELLNALEDDVIL